MHAFLPADSTQASVVQVELALDADEDLVAVCAALGVPPPADALPSLALNRASIIAHFRASRWLHRRLDFVNALLVSLESHEPAKDDGPYR